MQAVASQRRVPVNRRAIRRSRSVGSSPSTSFASRSFVEEALELRGPFKAEILSDFSSKCRASTYMLKIDGCNGKRFVQRRYADFARMSDAVRQHHSLPAMPPTSLFRCRLSPTFKEQRLLALGELVSAAVAADPFATHPALRAFLGLNAECSLNSSLDSSLGLSAGRRSHGSGASSMDSSLDSIAEADGPAPSFSLEHLEDHTALEEDSDDVFFEVDDALFDEVTCESVTHAREDVDDVEFFDVLPHLADGDAAVDVLADAVPHDIVCVRCPVLKGLSILRVVGAALQKLFAATLKFNLLQQMKLMISMLILLFQALIRDKGMFDLRWVWVLERLSSLVC